MRKLILFNMVTIDGYFEAMHDIKWHKVDEEVNEFITDQLNTADTMYVHLIKAKDFGNGNVLLCYITK